jgi:hypothetical protein
MKNFLLLLFLANTFYAGAQHLNTQLKQQLDSIMHKDQQLRKLFTQISPEEKEVILENFGYTPGELEQKGWEIVAKQDTLHINQVKEIISKHGYPGRSLVGTPTNKAAWYVIQHSNQIEKFFPLVQQAGDENEIPMTLVATMEDRILMYRGEEQKYGTQLKSGVIKDPETGKRKWQFYFWPVKSPEEVNIRRQQMGFETSIEEYARSMNVRYKELKLEDLK